MKTNNNDSFMNHSGTSPPTKRCTKCLVEKSLDDFYSKGKRCSSQCKVCEKSGKKTKYVAKKSQLNVRRLTKIFDIIHYSYCSRIQKEINKLDEVIERCLKKVEP